MMFRAVAKDPAVPVQAQSPQSAAASAKGPSKADRLIADIAPKAVTTRRRSVRVWARAAGGASVGESKDEASLGAEAS